MTLITTVATKPRVFVSDDGDTWIEWIHQDYRFALILNDKDPSWIYTSHQMGDSGELSSEIVDTLKKWATGAMPKAPS